MISQSPQTWFANFSKKREASPTVEKPNTRQKLARTNNQLLDALANLPDALEEALSLINKRLYLDDWNSAGFTPLLIAVQENNHRLFEALINAGADPNLSHIEMGINIAHMAAMKGHTCLLMRILNLQSDLLETKTVEENTPLMLAAIGEHSESIAFLLSIGADVNSQNHYGQTPKLFINRAKNSDEGLADLFTKTLTLKIKQEEINAFPEAMYMLIMSDIDLLTVPENALALENMQIILNFCDGYRQLLTHSQSKKKSPVDNSEKDITEIALTQVMAEYFGELYKNLGPLAETFSNIFLKIDSPVVPPPPPLFRRASSEHDYDLKTLLAKQLLKRLSNASNEELQDRALDLTVIQAYIKSLHKLTKLVSQTGLTSEISSKQAEQFDRHEKIIRTELTHHLMHLYCRLKRKAKPFIQLGTNSLPEGYDEVEIAYLKEFTCEKPKIEDEDCDMNSEPSLLTAFDQKKALDDSRSKVANGVRYQKLSL